MSVVAISQERLLKVISKVPAITRALSDDDAATVKRRQGLIDRRATIEVEDIERKRWLEDELAAVVLLRKKAEAALDEARAAVDHAVAAISNHNATVKAEKEAIETELMTNAGDHALPAVELLRRQLHDEFPRLIRSDPPLVKREVAVSKGGAIRNEIREVPDHDARIRQIRELNAAPEAAAGLLLTIADPAEILAKLDEIRRRFIRETEVAA